MDTESILRFWRQDNQLKRTARTGWVQRGVVGAESVAAHSHGVAFVALLLLELIPERLDRAKVLALAILHDLPEALTTDIPAPAWRYLPAGSKPAVESKALDEIFGDLPFAARWRALFTEHPNVFYTSFGNPYLSFELPHVPTLAVTYGGDALAQRAAVKVWLGEIAPQGTLPVQLPTVKIQPLPR